MRGIVVPAALAILLWPLAPAAAEPQAAPELEAPEADAVPAAELEVADTADPQAIDPQVWESLTVDISRLSHEPRRVTRRPQVELAAPEWKRADRPNGTAQFTVKKPLPLVWDARIGADLNPAAGPAYDRSQQPWPALNDRGTGAAWLDVAVPNLAAVELRMNSETDRSKFGASLSRSLPLGNEYKFPIENKFVVVEPSGVAPPVPSAVAPRAWNTDRMVQFDILSSGTTLLAGTTSSTANNVTHSKLAAEQKIYGPFNVTTALTDLGAPTAAKSISAGMKLNW